MRISTMLYGQHAGQALIGTMKTLKNRIHILQLLLQLPKMKFSVKQREIILTQIVDNIEIYGSPTVAAENLSYVIHCAKTIPDYNIDWNHQNQLML